MCSNKSTDRTNKKILQKPKPKYTAKPKKRNTTREQNNTRHNNTHSSTQQEQTANIKHDLFKCTQLFIGPGTRNKLSGLGLGLGLWLGLGLGLGHLRWFQFSFQVGEEVRDLCTWPGRTLLSGRRRKPGSRNLRCCCCCNWVVKNNFALYEIYVACLHIWCTQHRHLRQSRAGGFGSGRSLSFLTTLLAYKLHSNLELMLLRDPRVATPYFLFLNGFWKTFTQKCHRF